MHASLQPFFTRKFAAATMTAALITVCWFASNWLPGAAEHFGTLVAGLGASLGAFSAANVVQDHVMGKKQSPPTE